MRRQRAAMSAQSAGRGVTSILFSIYLSLELIGYPLLWCQNLSPLRFYELPSDVNEPTIINQMISTEPQQAPLRYQFPTSVFKITAQPIFPPSKVGPDQHQVDAVAVLNDPRGLCRRTNDLSIITSLTVSTCSPRIEQGRVILQDGYFNAVT